MFGENLLTEIKEVKIDQNGRITLPKFTLAETGENLYFLKLKNEIRIYGEEELQKVSKILFDNIKNNADYKTQARLKRIFFGLLLTEETVKKGNKIIIPKKLREEYKLDNNIILVGTENHLKIFNSKNYTLSKKHN